MKFIKVLHSLNHDYFVEDLAIKAMVKQAFSKTPEIKVIDFSIQINAAATGFMVFAKIIKPKNVKYSVIITAIEANINRYAFNLIGTKADNIELKFN